MRFFPIFLLICFTFSTLTAFDAYKVQFAGENLSPQALKVLESSSKALELESTPPATKAALRRRAEADLINLKESLQCLAYYHPIIDLHIDYETEVPIVKFEVDTGPIYPLASFEIIPEDDRPSSFDFASIDLLTLGIVIGEPAYPNIILESEEKLLFLLQQNGYPLAKIKEREVLADQESKQINVIYHVQSGPKCYFGKVIFLGQKRVSVERIAKKIQWMRGGLYDPCLIERTESALECSGLFSSITITPGDHPDIDGSLPIEIQVAESKHRSIAIGGGYSSYDGLGALAEWENRNIQGQGNKLAVKTLIAERLQDGSISYVIPDFYYKKQDLILLAEFERQTTKGYHAASYNFSATIEQQINDYTRFSYGLMYKKLHDTRSDNNGSFNLIKTPFHYRFRNTNSLLDPTRGSTFHIKVIPSIQVVNPQFAYCINTFSGTFYLPLFLENDQFVFAAKGTIGSIYGNSRHTIPPSERFYAGNEYLLRGYHYMTVSPLRGKKPIGGRSIMAYSLETRWRVNDTFGWVFFYDFGNVYKNYLPALNKQILQSIGFGLRYNTPVGPLRLDFAVPLHRRKGIDEKFQVYLSIGQAF